MALIGLPSGHAVVAILGAIVVLAAWYLSAPAYAFAFGHVALAAVLPEGAFAQGTHLGWMAVIEAGLLGILLASTLDHSPVRFGDLRASENRDDSEGLGDSASLAVVGVGLVLGWVVVGGALAWVSTRSSLGLPAASGLLVTPTALVAYGLHRYQLVSLGLVGDDEEDDEGGDEDE
jgi:hypothetical protein